MHRFKQKTHTIDLLFTVSLFCVFAVSALGVTVSGASLYQQTIRQADQDYTLFTSLSYLEQKVRGYDSTGGISVMKADGQDILCLHETIDQTAYTTYIYTMGGQLMELFSKDSAGSVPDLSSGTVLMDAGTLSIEETSSQLLHLTLETPEHTAQTLTLHLNAKE